ncbi:protein-L-isoaspartate(D-aspartate) O-methyltransferase-like [Ornithodoros turicata]|uniref:protein-L-isoaspartate(D-aspartate) O-methyltransferase-like n=1 Tax=Ornithodoros turicata TaxID=34597 RepID=UPI003139EF5A
MAWMSHGRSNDDMVAALKRNGLIRSDRVFHAMSAVDRGHYTRYIPYQDTPVYIGYGVTISAPKMHAIALEYLVDYLHEGARALDVGSGSGYLTACMAVMVGATGTVVGIDHIPELVHHSIENIKADQPGFIESGRIKMIVGDGRKGNAEEAPYNAIHVGAAAPEIPSQLIEQLKVGGRLLCPVGHQGCSQVMNQVDKLQNGSIQTSQLMDVLFVPLTDKESQWPCSGSSRYRPGTDAV